MTRCAPLMLLLATVLSLACLWPTKAHAGVTCSYTSASINFGTANTATGTIGYNCVNSDIVPYTFIICSTLGVPSAPGTTAQPVLLSGSYQMNFNVYTDAARTQLWLGSNFISGSVSVAALSSASGSMSFYGQIPTGQGPASGNYTASFNATTLGGYLLGLCLQNTLVVTGTTGGVSAAAAVPDSCSVTANTPLGLGTVAATATSTWGSTPISITCTRGTAYYVGLAPSNGSTTGAGLLTGTGGNTDKPPYQLRSGSNTGPVWGNTATATSVGNGVSGTGNAAPQSITAYATLPSANYRPDTYRDTVTVNVNF